MDFIESYRLPIPPIPEQKRIVAQLDELSAASQRLETIYKQKQKALEELKQALLHKAFSGDLTAQFDPMVPDEEGCYV
jgi:type I restriction enzyme S subunit